MDIINLETDYDNMCLRMRDKNLIFTLKTQYPDMNPKLLLSAFMIKNFAKHIGTIECELLNASITICNAIMKQTKDIQNEYVYFSQLFKTWREKDLMLMSQDVQNMTSTLHKTFIENPTVDHDLQWNHGVEQSIKHMNKTLHDIDLFSKSPPK